MGTVTDRDPLNPDIREEQYMAVFKQGRKIWRYFVTRETGPFEVISMNEDDRCGFNNKRLNNLVNVVMGDADYPTFPDEE